MHFLKKGFLKNRIFLNTICNPSIRIYCSIKGFENKFSKSALFILTFPKVNMFLLVRFEQFRIFTL